MTTASRGVVLAVAAVVLGAIILSQGYDEPVATSNVSTEGDDGGDELEPAEDDGGDDAAPADDGGETGADDTAGDDSGATDGGDAGTDAADDTGADAAPADDTGADTGAEDDPAPVLHEPAQVRVLVVNGTEVSGAAGQVNNDLIALGYNGLQPTNTNPVGAAEATAVYYEPGFELDARNLAQRLNAPPTAVEPLPEAIPVDDLLEANVVIILGPDLVTG